MGQGLERIAVLDVETTGFNARGNDRVLEIAIVTLDARGHVVDEMSTLVNPSRDVGPTHIHGIRAADVIDAPTFASVAGDILERLQGATVVGHNVRFDERFVRAEFLRAGVDLPRVPLLCTLRLSCRLDLPSISRSLEDCCAAVGVELENAHCALSDARAAALLLAACLPRSRGFDMSELIQRDASGQSVWPVMAPSRRLLPRDEARARQKRQIPLLAQLVELLPMTSDATGDATAYLATLDRALADRRVSAEEAEALVAIAQEHGLGRADVGRLHREYLAALCRAAVADGVVTSLEQDDLESVRCLLGVEATTLAEELVLATATSAAQASQMAGAARLPMDMVGRSVCFTGELLGRIDGRHVSRAEAEDMARAAGMAIAKGVTKSLNYLVVADPDSMSGKARKARAYGTTILAETVFWRAIGAVVE